MQKRVDEMIESILGIDKNYAKNINKIRVTDEYLKGSKNIQSTVTLEESLDMLNLHIKYNVFDLEATRRENQYLRRILKQRDH